MKFNYLGFVSVLSLLAIFYFPTGNLGLLGFLGFTVYFRYFFVKHDEMLKSYIKKSATVGFFSNLIAFAPLVFVSSLLFDSYSRAWTFSLAASWSIGVIAFSLTLVYHEHQERKYAT